MRRVAGLPPHVLRRTTFRNRNVSGSDPQGAYGPLRWEKEAMVPGNQGTLNGISQEAKVAWKPDLETGQRTWSRVPGLAHPSRSRKQPVAGRGRASFSSSSTMAISGSVQVRPRNLPTKPWPR